MRCDVLFQAFPLEQTSASLQTLCSPFPSPLLRRKSPQLLAVPLARAQAYKKLTGAVILRLSGRLPPRVPAGIGLWFPGLVAGLRAGCPGQGANRRPLGQWGKGSAYTLRRGSPSSPPSSFSSLSTYCVFPRPPEESFYRERSHSSERDSTFPEATQHRSPRRPAPNPVPGCLPSAASSFVGCLFSLPTLPYLPLPASPLPFLPCLLPFPVPLLFWLFFWKPSGPACFPCRGRHWDSAEETQQEGPTARSSISEPCLLLPGPELSPSSVTSCSSPGRGHVVAPRLGQGGGPEEQAACRGHPRLCGGAEFPSS